MRRRLSRRAYYAIGDLARVGGFELRLNKRVLGTISLSPVPPATLTSEGGFKPPPNFTWTVTAEEELLDTTGAARAIRTVVDDQA